jgi:hypothetical protein
MFHNHANGRFQTIGLTRVSAPGIGAASIEAGIKLQGCFSTPNPEVVSAIKKPPRDLSLYACSMRELRMSQVKRDMGRFGGLHFQAIEVALQAKALKECSFPGHSDLVLDQGDDEATRFAYAIGANRWERGEIDGGREEFLDAIKHAIKGAPYDCPRCDRMMAKD